MFDLFQIAFIGKLPPEIIKIIRNYYQMRLFIVDFHIMRPGVFGGLQKIHKILAFDEYSSLNYIIKKHPETFSEFIKYFIDYNSRQDIHDDENVVQKYLEIFVNNEEYIDLDHKSPKLWKFISDNSTKFAKLCYSEEFIEGIKFISFTDVEKID